MKKIVSFVICIMALLFAACEEHNAPATSNKVETGAASDITTESVVLHGVVNVDISQYDDVEFGMMVSEDKAELNARDGEMYKAKVLIGKDFELTLEGLSPDTKYYYCAWVFLNNTQYEFGEISHAQLEEHVHECIEALYLPEGGLTLNIELNYEVPMDNCYALLEAVEKYRHYK